jgi:hypothetical protein
LREFIIFLIKFGIVGIRFIFQNKTGIVLAKYFIASSVVEVTGSMLFILSTNAIKQLLKSQLYVLGPLL